MKNILLTFYISSVGITANSQTNSLEQKSSSFQEMLIVNDNLLAIDDKGKLFIWDLQSLQKSYSSDNDIFHYTSIAIDRNNQIYLGTNKGRIFKFNTTDHSIDQFLKLKREYVVSRIFFNSTNEIFLIVPYAVFDPINNKSWTDFDHDKNGMIVRKRVFLFFTKTTTHYFDMPQYSFIDSEDRIWMMKSFGEFGGSLQLFDTNNRKAVNTSFNGLDFGLLFPKSVFEDDKENIYITSGLQHFSNTGEIYQIKDSSATLIYTSEDFKDTTNTNTFEGGIFVGPGAFNNNDRKIYFATTDGFYRADLPESGRIKNPQFIFSPSLDWEREPLAIGISMTIKKLEIAKNGKLIFLTSKNGIGVYDGERLVMLK